MMKIESCIFQRQKDDKLCTKKINIAFIQRAKLHNLRNVRIKQIDPKKKKKIRAGQRENSYAAKAEASSITAQQQWTQCASTCSCIMYLYVTKKWGEGRRERRRVDMWTCCSQYKKSHRISLGFRQEKATTW